MQQPGRNDPCPCGSGRKYKRCHLAKAAERHAPAAVHALDSRLAAEMFRYARKRFGDEWLHDAQDLIDAEKDLTLLATWSVYHARVRDRTIAEWFLEERGGRLSAAERRWLDAQGAAWVSVWQVVAVEPGSSLELEDLLSGERRSVQEASASTMLVVRDSILARIVTHGDLAVVCGVHSRVLPPAEAAEVVRKVRARARVKRGVRPERLRSEELARYLIDRWAEEVAELDRRRRTLPHLRNTDGDGFVLVADHFEFDPARRAEVEAALASLDGVAPPDEGHEDATYTFLREGNAQHASWDNTVLGTARVSDGALRLETNSVERADLLARRLRESLGGLLREGLRDLTDPEPLLRQMVQERDRAVDEPTPREAEPILREWKQRHYSGWADERLPALDGQTPREAVRMPRGREQVEILIRQLENAEAREPEGTRFDVSAIRIALGLGTGESGGEV